MLRVRVRNRAAALALMCMLYMGCGRAYVIHPGAVNTFDSQTYDALLAAKTTIDVGREQLASGALNQSVKPILNVLIEAYNIATPAYKVYHDAASKGLPTDQYLTALNKDMIDLANALVKFKGGK